MIMDNELIRKGDILRFFEENCYPVRYDNTSLEKGMTLAGIKQVIEETPNVNAIELPSIKAKAGSWDSKGFGIDIWHTREEAQEKAMQLNKELELGQ